MNEHKETIKYVFWAEGHALLIGPEEMGKNIFKLK